MFEQIARLMSPTTQYVKTIFIGLKMIISLERNNRQIEGQTLDEILYIKISIFEMKAVIRFR